MKIKCIAIDDEPLALQIIEDYIAQVPYLDLQQSFRNPLKAFDFIQKNQIELIFLDINMPNLSGIQFIKTLSNKPSIILTTAYSEYAVESYGLNVLDYLLKPIEFDRFLRAANKAMNASFESSKAISYQPTVETEYIFIKDGNKLQRIDCSKILYIEAAGNYQAIQLPDKKVLSLIKMSELLATLNNPQFVRVHKSYAVQINKIDLIENHRILIGDKYIPISKSYRQGFYKKLKQE
jgi:DNA-binding LytR/AlgR family response regulator